VRREAWERYVAYLRTKYKREDIFKEYEGVAGQIQKVSKQAAAHRDNELETYGTTLPPKTLVLTYDDGPHSRYTDRILETLKKNNVKAVFFTVGENLGTVKDGKIKAARSAAAALRAIEAGHSIGSHTFSHTALPTMSDREVAAEIETTNKLLEGVLNLRTPLFRPPYGATDAKVTAAVESHKMRSVLWTIDSEDWADPVAKSIANRVIAEARRLNKGIILMHDIHERTIDATPLIIETLRAEGFRFLSWNGEGFIDDKPLVTEAAPAPPPPAPAIYRDSWAVVVGIDDYPKWPKLHYAVNDAKGVKDLLTSKFGFKQDHVFTLLNGEATRARILSVLGDTLANPKRVQREDRVFVFFAGHGATRKLPNGRDLGYIVPFDADPENFQGQSISMSNFQDISEAIPAKHVFFVMDSCYSGLALTRGVGTAGNYIREVSRRTARQMLTAGGSDEEVADNGPNGHSIFTWTVLQGLEGRADLNSDGFISASELSSFVAPSVSGVSRQTPAFGALVGNEGGEFLFELHPEVEMLSNLSSQLDREAIELNAELEKIRKEVEDKAARNQQLREQVAAAQANAAQPPNAKEASSHHLNQGMSFYREQRYQQALDEYLLAAKLDPSSATAANNVGFVYHKMQKLDDAAKWLEKTVAIDPRRGIAYANLGDVYYEMNRKPDARRAYEKFLQLSPNSSYASDVRKRLQ
jgi:peptidoglycan/xylan/chitin deacetylase (PgdA/CDA1 family)